MKVQICTGSNCVFYGANGIIERLMELQEDLHTYPGIPETAELELEMIPCQHFCKTSNAAPVVFIEGQKVENAHSSQVMELILNTLQETDYEK